MLNFQEEISKFKPSLDVDDIEEAIGGMDLSDMSDVMIRLMIDASLNARPGNKAD